MKQLVRKNLFFLSPALLFFIFGAIVLTLKSKEQIHLAINGFHNSTLDFLFKYGTHLGDGFFVLAVGIVLLLINYRYFLYLGLVYLFASVPVQLLKHYVFQGHLRPTEYFEGKLDLYLVPGVEVHGFNSFPSGHSATAMALFFSITLLVKNKNLKAFLFLLTLFVLYSRMYLSQHFFEDVYAGAAIGFIAVLPAALCVPLVRKQLFTQ